jgi:hypothetical protein
MKSPFKIRLGHTGRFTCDYHSFRRFRYHTEIDGHSPMGSPFCFHRVDPVCDFLPGRIQPCRLLSHRKTGSPKPDETCDYPGIIGTVLSAVGAILGADLGPVWYAWTLAVIAIPIAWLGGKLYEIKHAASGSEYIIKQ